MAKATKQPAPAILDPARATAAVEYVAYAPTPPVDVAGRSNRPGLVDALAGRKVRDVLVARAFMNETHGGGGLENVPGFDSAEILTGDIAQPGRVRWPQLRKAPERPEESGGWLTESVLLPDTRRPVPGTASLPWRCVALLAIQYASGQTGRGTGWLIGPRTLVTAAHCVHSKKAGPATRIVVTPGFDRGAAPYGQYEVTGSLWNPAWRTSFDPVLDFALLYIGNDPGTGWFGYAAVPDANLERVLVNIAGYPNDRPPTQWYDAGRVASADASFIYHQIDTAEGQSGAALFWTDRVQRIGLGIHTYGADGGMSVNRARRITPELYQLFQANTR